MKLDHSNPGTTYDSLKSRGYSQVVSVEGAQRLIYLSGQLPLAADGSIVGKDDIAKQARQVFENIRLSLESAGAELSNVVKMTTFVTDVTSHPGPVRIVRAEYFGVYTPPTSTMVEVPRFAHPDIMIEIDVVAAT